MIPVEKVARAICEADCTQNYDGADCLGAGEECYGWEDCKGQARAAIEAHIEALMEPSAGMIKVGEEAFWIGSDDYGDPASVWQAMLRAALEEIDGATE